MKVAVVTGLIMLLKGKYVVCFLMSKYLNHLKQYLTFNFSQCSFEFWVYVSELSLYFCIALYVSKYMKEYV